MTPAGQMKDDRLAEMFGRHHVVIAYLFGSRAEGRARPGSDHDVAVLFREPPSLMDATQRLGSDLAAVLGTQVDIVDLDAGTLELRGKVAMDGQLLFSVDEVRRVRFEVDARMRWIEFQPVLAMTTRGYLSRVTEKGLR